MINNFDLIQNILSFEDPGDFYYLQILQRKKDINNTVSSSNHRVVKSYYINSIEEFTNRFLKENSIDPIDIHKDNPTLLYYNDLSCK